MAKDCKLDDLDQTARALVASARATMAHAHAPYSCLRVGAALELEDGRVVVGCNVENASYGLTICAERVALGSAVATGAASDPSVASGARIIRIAVTSDRPTVLMPCGACRQVLMEFASSSVEVHCVDSEDRVRSTTLEELLPDAMGPSDLATSDGEDR